MEKTNISKNSRKKWWILAIAAVALACLGIAAGCKREPNYYTFTYRMPQGLTLICKHEDGSILPTGTEIREGYRVSFIIEQDKFCTGTPVVRLNGQIIHPENGVYSFVMEKNSAIIVDPSSVSYTPHYTVEFTKGPDDRIWFEYEGQEVEGGFQTDVVVGEEVEFKLRTSVYYSSEFEVYANTEEVKLKAGTSDTSSFLCTDDTVITVYGLTTGLDFYSKLQHPYVDAFEALSDAYDAALDDPEKGEAIAGKYRDYIAAETARNNAQARLDAATSAEERAAQQEIINAQNAIMQSIASDPDAAGLIAKRVAFIAARDIFEAAGKTRSNPFKITSAVDLYAMAYYINDSFNVGMGFQTAYYRMENSIDLCGEQLFIIGDTVNDSAVFCGEFDGGGYKISNFYMSDFVVDQEEGFNLYLPYIGMFGFVSAARGFGAPAIRNLTLENYTVDVDAGRHVAVGDTSRLHIGGLVGAATGATVSGCSASGTLRLSGNNDVFSTVGGLIGYAEPIVTDSVEYPFVISACSTDVSIQCANRVWAAGGIVGYTITSKPTVNVSVLNSCAKGRVVGAVNTGGIVGHLNDNTSVINCYSSGAVIASSNYQLSGTPDADRFCFANAGGIVGYAEANTVIANCFSLGAVTAVSLEGAKYQKTGAIYGNAAEDGENYADARKVVVVHPHEIGAVIDKNYIQNTLGWGSVSAWKFGAELLPEPDPTASIAAFTVTINTAGESVEGRTTLTADEYRPMSYWYAENRESASNGLSEYLAGENGKRTYGYFFDAEGTMRVPDAFVPTSNVTLYARFADYGEVKGTYYLKNQDGAYITLNADGTFLFSGGALREEGIYSYDGEAVMLFDSCLGYMSNLSDFYYTAFKAVKNGDTLVISEPAFYPRGQELVAVAKSANFVCGEYYDTNDVVYSFFENGNGVRVIGTSVVSFTYTADGEDAFRITLSGGGTLNGTLSSGVPATVNGLDLTAFDTFKGVWKKQVTTLEEYEFDGKFTEDNFGSWTYRRYRVEESGKRTLDESKAGSYTVAGGVLTAVGEASFTASFEDGLLKIVKSGNTLSFGANEGYIGVWRFPNQTEPATLELKGLNSAGVGEAVLTFDNSDSAPYALRYEVVSVGGVPTIYLYWGAVGFGALRFYESKINNTTGRTEISGTLEGEMYSERLGAVRPESSGAAVFYLQDNFFGTWQGEDGGFFTEVTFNGKGYYKLARGTTHMAVSGSVSVKTKDAKTYNVAYSVAQGTEDGTFTIRVTVPGQSDSVVYTFAFDESGNLVITYDSGYAGTDTDLTGTHVLHRV